MIRVLIVDDDKLARKGLISLVNWQACGMEVVGEAANGERAMAFLSEHPVDLAVVDLSMPVMSGLTFIEKSRVLWPKLQYVVLSFHEDFENVQAALRLGTLDYISKMRLEQVECEALFLRISHLMRADSEPDQTVPAQWPVLEQEWLSLCWLYTAPIMEDLLSRTKACDISMRQLEHLLVRLSDKMQQIFQTATLPAIPSVTEVDVGLSWLVQARADIAGFVQTAPARNNEICIFHAVQYICDHLQQPLSIYTVAEQVGISRSYFATNFKRTTGVTFNTFLRQARIDLAQTLLQQGRATPQTVAEAVGYEDPKHFHRIFTKQTGLSPHVYFQKYHKGSHPAR